MKQKFKKFIALISCAVLFMTQFGFSSHAVNVAYPVMGEISREKADIYSDAGTTSINASSKKLDTLKMGDKVFVEGEKKDADGDLWYKIKYGASFDKEGYAYSGRVKLTPVYETDEEFEKHLTEQNFPESYKVHLRLLHQLYPSWVFYADHVKDNFNTAVSKLAYSDSNREHYKLVSKYRDGSWKSMENGAYDWKDNVWEGIDGGDSWVAASERVVAYHVDPRNFLNTSNIFMFFTQSYNSETDTLEGVKKFLKGTFMEGAIEDDPTKTYAEVIFDAGKKFGVSPYLLAATIRQEQGTTGKDKEGNWHGSISGTYEGYVGYYNYFNVGAYDSNNMDAVERGLWWAKGAGNNSTDYGRPWNTRTKAIYGGASFYGNGYINVGQNTLYYKNFNVYKNSKHDLYTHHYATNIEDSKSTSITLGKAYEDYYGEVLSFNIPVYKNMPEKTTLPTSGTSNDRYLTGVTVGDTEITGFNRYKYEYEIIVPHDDETLDITPILSNSSSKVTGGGKHKIDVGDNEIKLEVTSSSGLKSTYTINIFREKGEETVLIPEIKSEYFTQGYVTNIQPNTSISDFKSKLNVVNGTVKILASSGSEKTSGNIATGDKVYIYKTDNTLYQTISVIIYGDINGDGKINALDGLALQRHVLKEKLIGDVYLTAADTSDDGKVNAIDGLVIQRHVLLEKAINQSRNVEEN